VPPGVPPLLDCHRQVHLSLSLPVSWWLSRLRLLGSGFESWKSTFSSWGSVGHVSTHIYFVIIYHKTDAVAHTPKTRNSLSTTSSMVVTPVGLLFHPIVPFSFTRLFYFVLFDRTKRMMVNVCYLNEQHGEQDKAMFVTRK